jgi:hypothetical protein|tara:strand:+ start:2180 stop:2287 length:108 start_codon:yes stop_codon:yes gene_type:complete
MILLYFYDLLNDGKEILTGWSALENVIEAKGKQLS